MALDGGPEYRTGLTIAEVASVLDEAGAVDGFSLDGGGSSTLVTRDRGAASVTVRNHPSGGVERPVPNGIGILAGRWHRADPGPTHHGNAPSPSGARVP